MFSFITNMSTKRSMLLILLAAVIAIFCLFVRHLFRHASAGDQDIATVLSSSAQDSTLKEVPVARNGGDLPVRKIPTNNDRISFFAYNDTISCDKSSLAFSVRALHNFETNVSQFRIADYGILEPPAAPRTISAVIVHERNLAVERVAHFDVSIDDMEFRNFLMQQAYFRVLLLSSFGDIAGRLTSPTLTLLVKHYGAANNSFGNPFGSIVFIGQKGLEYGRALTKLVGFEDVAKVQIAGCLKLPMGKLDSATPFPPRTSPNARISRYTRSDFVPFDRLPSCSNSPFCDADFISVVAYSGKNKDDQPRICVNGKVIMSKSVNEGGRGLNIVLLDATVGEVTGIGHFDTYEEDSSLLEDFFREIEDGEIVIVVSFDEASQKLSYAARQGFYELGSALIWSLKFRSSWYLVGQKGIGGFSPHEELNFAKGNDWATPINKSLCVSPNFGGHGLAQLASHRNIARRRFCDKYDGYEDFCENKRIDEFIFPAKLTDASRKGDSIFDVPILVVAGLSQNSLRLCLESLIAQPGVDPNMVLVCHDENYPESSELAELFHLRTKAVVASASYAVQLAMSFDILWSEFPNATMAIVIEEELILTPDFLSFMSQMLSVLQKDEQLAAVSAWNINGFSSTSTAANIAYRVEEFPGFAFMIRKDIYEKFMKGQMDQCCLRRSWEGWSFNYSSFGRLQTIIPDVSRVSRRHVDGFDEIDQNAEDYFHRRRSLSSNISSVISNVQLLISERTYDASLRTLISSSVALNGRMILEQCAGSSANVWSWLASTTRSSKKQSFVIYFDNGVKPNPLIRLRRCFGLYYRSGLVTDKTWMRRGFYKGVLRFSITDGKSILLIGIDSQFYPKDMPKRESAA